MWVLALLLPGLLSGALGCATSYRSALGYRARAAAVQQNVAEFEALMAEAATTLPKNPLDNPKRTVLTHFLELGGSPEFFPTLERWRERGWVAEEMTCAIERARWRGVFDSDPAEADRAAEACLFLAREGAEDPELAWRLDACLGEAPFLTRSSTEAIAGFVARAADPAEPPAFRRALLEGLTRVFLSEPARLRENDPSLDPETARRRSARALREIRARFTWIVRAVKPTTDLELLAHATAFGALEIERVSLALGETFFDDVLGAGTTDDADLVWAWVRSIKSGPRIARLEPLGLTDRRREPAEDAYWYACARQARSASGGEVIETVEAARRGGLAAGAPPCPDRPGALRVVGPFPLEATALAAARRRDEDRTRGRTQDHDHN